MQPEQGSTIWLRSLITDASLVLEPLLSVESEPLAAAAYVSCVLALPCSI